MVKPFRALLLLLVLLLLAVSTSAYNNGLGRLPPMGWNTWCTDDACGAIDICTEKQIKSVVDGIVAQGLDKLGYRYINMDDCWSALTRDSNGRLQPNSKHFPSGLRNLSDYIHSKGLYFGLYTCVGTQTCRGGRPGSYGYYDVDANTFANDWQMDFIKADNCHRPSNLSVQVAYTALSQALNKTGRPMLFSLCEWGVDNVTQWGGNVGQMWRVQMDHLPFWHWPPTAAGMGFGQGTYDIIEYVGTLNPSQFTGPYNHMDPDFLETLFPLTLTAIDSRTEFTFWSLWSAPLIVATDLRNLTAEKAAIITNTEVIAVDQDPLSQAGDRLYKSPTNQQVWRKFMVNNTEAVVLYNGNLTQTQDVTVTREMLSISSNAPVQVRDLWAKKDLGALNATFTASQLKPHDVQFLLLSFQGRT